MEFIKLSASLNRARISDSNYKHYLEFLEKLGDEKLNSEGESSPNFSAKSVTPGTAGQNYNYAIEKWVHYTTWKRFYYTAGQNVNISISTPSNTHVFEFFNETSPNFYS